MLRRKLTRQKTITIYKIRNIVEEIKIVFNNKSKTADAKQKIKLFRLLYSNLVISILIYR